MNPTTGKQLRLPVNWKGKPSPRELAQALKSHIHSTGLQHGELMPAALDYAVANQLRRNQVTKAFDLLKAEGLLRLNRSRRHVIHIDHY